ncbi:probable cadmium/zinc-transporting ATPase HMA1, chloroplastic [Macadamia integrifolia]|uniref:probable cadmium/zinc-transporting ATPase HMA1, chloroplastic n=1 Tax=Macadamia integrifolia TaxID=60698 RepID=UPI001C52ADF0|nr:probable cadmium/zinc-transporting ATPase HMA1, chloroplastic [Macadamia integrifolia]
MEALPFAVGSRGFRTLNSRRRRIASYSSHYPVYKQIDFSYLLHKPFHASSLRCRTIACLAQGNDNHHHRHQDHHQQHHHHSHPHHHHHDHHQSEVPVLNRSQEAVLRFAKAIGWIDLANFLREHLQLCCCSTAMLLVAAACPYLFPKSVMKPVQNAFIAVAFPLVGVSAALDALIDITAGKVNIHVLMALAAFASVFMGNALEGGLLLAMFNLAHIAEEYFTSRSMIDVKELKENHPDFALVLEVDGDNAPHFSDLTYKRVAVHDVEVGSYVLVRAGESVPVDGEVFHGRATIAIEHLTGEAKPLETKVGDRVPGGARNLDGMMIVKATKTWNESTLNRIVKLTEEAHLNKPKLQRWLDEFGEHYSKVVVALSCAVALIGPLLFKWPFIGSTGTL